MSFSSTKFEIHRHTEKSPWTYEALDVRQREIRDAVLAGERGVVLLSEVAPVVTLGRRKTHEDLLLPPGDYIRRGIALFEASRGGRATYHGPGQWVVFVVDSLERLTGDRRGVRKFVCALFNVALEICRERFPLAEIREGAEAGVWSEPGVRGLKLAAMGVQIDQGIVQHGFSLNVFSTPQSFFGINPCGLSAGVGFLESASSPESMEYWRTRLERVLSSAFPGGEPQSSQCAPR